MVRGPAGWIIHSGMICSLVALLWAAPAEAQGVAVFPSRVVLDGRTRAATAFVSNRSDQAETYRVSLAYLEMAEDGALVRADSLGQAVGDFAAQVLQYSPRRMVIPAGGSQTLRLLVRRPAGLDVENREFRAHLSIISVPDIPRLEEVAETLPQLDENTFIARAQASVETLVPVVVRFGRPDASIELGDVSLVSGLEDGGPALEFVLERAGDRSVYGDLLVDHVADGGERTNLHTGRGVAIYANRPRRIFRVDLDGHPDLDPRRGRFVISYRETAAGGGDLVLERQVDAGEVVAHQVSSP